MQSALLQNRQALSAVAAAMNCKEIKSPRVKSMLSKKQQALTSRLNKLDVAAAAAATAAQGKPPPPPPPKVDEVDRRVDPADGNLVRHQQFIDRDRARLCADPGCSCTSLATDAAMQMGQELTMDGQTHSQRLHTAAASLTLIYPNLNLLIPCSI